MLPREARIIRNGRRAAANADMRVDAYLPKWKLKHKRVRCSVVNFYPMLLLAAAPHRAMDRSLS